MILVEGDNQYVRELSNAGDKLVVVDWFATWCGPCRALEPFMKSLEAKYPEAVFLKVDVDTTQSSAAQAGIRAMPTIHVYRKASKLEEVVGANPAAIEGAVSKHYKATTVFSGTGRRLTDAAVPAVGSSAPGAAPAHVATPDGLGSSGDTDIQIRLPSGDVVKGKFDATATLGQLRTWVAPHVGSVNFNLMLPGFPKKYAHILASA